MEYTDLTVDEIQRQLSQIEQSRTDLEKALEQRRQRAKYELADHIRGLILGNGYEIAEIAALLSTKKRRGGAVAQPVVLKTVREYVKYVDPDNPSNVYVRGVIPGWMKQKMQDQGYNPGSRPDREAFKANFLQVRED